MNSLKSLLRKWPWLYHVIQRWYHSIRRFLETKMIGTKGQQLIWQTRHLRDGDTWIKGYLESVHHPHRLLLAKTILGYAPLDSILEIGCSSGPNLILLSGLLPSTSLYGIDISNKSIEIGNEYIRKEGLVNIHLSSGKAHQLSQFPDKSMDAVFCDAALIYIGHDLIHKVVSEILRITRKVCIFNEWHGDAIRNESSYHMGHWVHNYKRLFTSHGIQESSIKSTKIPDEIFGDPGWSQFGNIVEVIL